jgi:hypothetical protein
MGRSERNSGLGRLSNRVGLRGQATTEYLLLLATIVIIFVTVVKKGLGPLYQRLTTSLINRMENQFLNGDLHSIKVRRPR